ncbi:hypothetical protein M0R45_015787 [Rubus argutus]|uniref:Uncharacterized protein n=1 Tax=Rubus argutus TaxID=59490 RepID=A0AAW1XRK6_RUBAR
MLPPLQFRSLITNHNTKCSNHLDTAGITIARVVPCPCSSLSIATSSSSDAVAAALASQTAPPSNPCFIQSHTRSLTQAAHHHKSAHGLITTIQSSHGKPGTIIAPISTSTNPPILCHHQAANNQIKASYCKFPEPVSSAIPKIHITNMLLHRARALPSLTLTTPCLLPDPRHQAVAHKSGAVASPCPSRNLSPVAFLRLCSWQSSSHQLNPLASTLMPLHTGSASQLPP